MPRHANIFRLGGGSRSGGGGSGVTTIAPTVHHVNFFANVWLDDDEHQLIDSQNYVFVIDKLTDEYGTELEKIANEQEFQEQHYDAISLAQTNRLQWITYTYNHELASNIKVLYVDSSCVENVQELYTRVFKMAEAEKQDSCVLRMPLLGVSTECTDQTKLNDSVQAARNVYEGYSFSLDLCHAQFKKPDMSYQCSLQIVNTQEASESGEEASESGEEASESAEEALESAEEASESAEEALESAEEALESERDDDVQGANNEDDDQLRVKVAPEKRSFDEVQTEQNIGRKRYKEGGAVKTTFLLLDQVDKKDHFERPVMETQLVEVFLVTGFHKGTLSIDLQTNRAMEISREAVSVFFHALLQPNNLFVQTLVVERIILLEVGNTKYLVSGQHRGAMLLLLHLGMVPVLTAQNKPFFIRRAEAKNYDDSAYNYDSLGLNPDIKWGYKNWQKWEAALKQALNKSGRIKELAQKKLKKYNSCFEWIRILQRLKCFEEVDDEDKSLLDAATFFKFYNSQVCFFSVSKMSRQDLYKFFVSSLCVQKPYCFDTMIGMSCGEIIGVMKDELPIYEARDNIVLQNLYLRSALPNNDPTSSFYVDVALANILIEGTTGTLNDINLRNAFNSLVMFSAKEYIRDDMLASLLLFEKLCENSSEFKSRIATRFKRVVRVLEVFDSSDAQIRHRCDALKLFRRTGGFTLRDALVLFWYRVMNVTDFPFDDLEDYDFTGYVVPNGASLIQCEEEGVYKPETKTGLFCDLLQIVGKPKFKLFKDAAIASHEVCFPWHPSAIVDEEEGDDDED